MGTRHTQTVINKRGQVKVRQYGQWDGYPDGQGVEILNFLKESDLNKYNKQLNKLNEVTDEQWAEVDKAGDDWKKEYPYLSRDCGSDIHQMILDNKVKFVQHVDEKEANQWCSGFYTIDLKKGLFISEFDGDVVELSLDNLPTKEEYLGMFNQDC